MRNHVRSERGSVPQSRYRVTVRHTYGDHREVETTVSVATRDPGGPHPDDCARDLSEREMADAAVRAAVSKRYGKRCRFIQEGGLRFSEYGYLGQIWQPCPTGGMSAVTHRVRIHVEAL